MSALKATFKTTVRKVWMINGQLGLKFRNECDNNYPSFKKKM